MNIFILEDDVSYALELERLCNSWGYKVIGVFDNVNDADRALKIQKPDLILSDIHLKGSRNGLSFCKDIKDLSIPVVFLTSDNHERTFVKTEECNMLAFLVKPVDQLTLKSVLDLSRNAPQAKGASKDRSPFKKDGFLLKKKNVYQMTEYKDIMYIQSDLEYVYIITKEDKFVLRESLKNFVQLLSADNFFRCHKSYIINLNFLHSIDINENFLYLNDDQTTKIPLSRRKKMDLVRTMKLLN